MLVAQYGDRSTPRAGQTAWSIYCQRPKTGDLSKILKKTVEYAVFLDARNIAAF